MDIKLKRKAESSFIEVYDGINLMLLCPISLTSIIRDGDLILIKVYDAVKMRVMVNVSNTLTIQDFPYSDVGQAMEAIGDYIMGPGYKKVRIHWWDQGGFEYKILQNDFKGTNFELLNVSGGGGLILNLVEQNGTTPFIPDKTVVVGHIYSNINSDPVQVSGNWQDGDTIYFSAFNLFSIAPEQELLCMNSVIEVMVLS